MFPMSVQKGEYNMKRYTVALTVCLCIAFPASLRASPQVSPQNQEPKNGAAEYHKKPTKYSAAPPKGEFQDNQFVELAPDQDRRVVRENRYKNTYPVITDPADTSAGPKEDFILQISDYAEPLDPFPVARSAAVLIGTVLSGKAFVSKDRTYVYSDYQVHVDQVLKQDPSANLAVGDQVVVSRGGGTIHFPSGHIRNYINRGEGYPAVGSQYLFFLVKPDFPQAEYEVIIGAAYLLSGGKIHPLDDSQLGQFDNMSESVFMSKVEHAIRS
jgi:hypothetical protein